MAYQPGPEPQFDPYRSDILRSHTPDQPVFHEPLLPPTARYLDPSVGPSTPRQSYATNNSVNNSANNSTNNSAPLLPGVREKGFADPSTFMNRKSQPFYKKPLVWVIAAVGVALVAAAVVVPLYFTVIKPKNNTSVTGGSGGSDNGTNGTNPDDSPTNQPPANGISGGDGSTIKTDNGSEFLYTNPYGGICESSSKFPRPALLLNTTLGVSDPDDPFNDNAYPNSWTPPLNTSWTWGKDKLYGYASSSVVDLLRSPTAVEPPSVNLGGWFVLEPFITPTLFQKYQPEAVDEWSISVAMAADTANGGLSQLEDHYKTFIVSDLEYLAPL